MSGFDLSLVPLWVWILVIIAFIALAPLKLRTLKKMLGKKDRPEETDGE